MVKAMNFTGIRIERYEELKAVRRELGKKEYASAVEDLNKKEISARRAAEKRRVVREKREEEARQEELRQEQIREAEREKKREEARLRRNEARRTKTAQANVIIDIKTKKITDNDEYKINIQLPIINALKKTIGDKYAYIQLSVNGEIVKQELVQVKDSTAELIYWNSVFDFINEYSAGIVSNVFINRTDEGGNVVSLNDDDDIRFVILKANKMPSKAIQQKYRDGVKHCVLQPLWELWNKMAQNSEKESSKKRCRQIANRILHLIQNVYPDGVPDGTDMEVVARVCHRCIVIHDIIGSEITRYNKSSPKLFRFTNTRMNHLESGQITWDCDYERVTKEQMAELLYEHDKEQVFYLYGGNITVNSVLADGCHSLRSVRGAWAVFNDEYDIYNEFNKTTGIKNYGVNPIKHSELNEFVFESRVINSAPTPLCDSPNDLEGVNHIDLEKAYTQHAKCKFYRGFLGHIVEWSKLSVDTDSFLANHVGIFQFVVLKNTNELLSRLGITVGNKYVLPSPEIEFMRASGVEVKLIAGCWGSTFDIEYTEEMLQKTTDGNNKRYCIWAGKLGMNLDAQTYTFKGDSVWAMSLKHMLGDDNVFYFSHCNMIVVRIPKKSYLTRHHILSFITSYTRINMLETMMKIEDIGGELVKVILDGIYFRGEIPDIEIPHKTNKDMKEHIGFRDAWYYPSKMNCSGWEAFNDKFDIPADKIQNVIVLTGAGGTGKSYSVLHNRAIPKVLYVVPTHALGRKMHGSIGVEYTTIHKLIGCKSDGGEMKTCRRYTEDHNEPAVVFIDEITMIPDEWVQRAIDMHPNTKFFIAGDVDKRQWFQCRNGYPGAFSKIWMPTEEHHIVKYEIDYRAKDSELKELKIALREEMHNVFTDGGDIDAVRMRIFLKKYAKEHQIATVAFADAVGMFVPGDVWIAGTHKTNEKLLEAGVVSGYINKDKEIVSEEETGAKKRGSFTTHSFQGFTLSTERVFISLDFFEYAMLYTSISRVCNMSQLVIVV